MSNPIKTVQAIVQALRGSPPMGITRGNGNVPRRISDPSLTGVQKNTQYDRYRQIQHNAGESPVSYEEWMQK